MEWSSWQGKNLFSKRLTAWPCHGVPTAKRGTVTGLSTGLCLFVFRLACLLQCLDSPQTVCPEPSCALHGAGRWGTASCLSPLTSMSALWLFVLNSQGHTEQNMLVPWVWVLVAWPWVGALLSVFSFSDLPWRFTNCVNLQRSSCH